jgi:hypothetical protein
MQKPGLLQASSRVRRLRQGGCITLLGPLYAPVAHDVTLMTSVREGAVVDFEQRQGGRTLRLSPLNSVFVDPHKTWYAIHWTTYLHPSGFVDFCFKDLEISAATSAIVRSSKGNSEGTFDQVRVQVYVMPADSIGLLRLDGQEFVLVWEPSAEYHHLLSEGKDVPYGALIGFGSDKFDPEFGKRLLRKTATEEIMEASDSIWDSLGFLANTFKRENIDPSGR